jgi:MFS family permease
MIGRRRAFAIAYVIYGIGSLTTALASNLPVLFDLIDDPGEEWD